jgi:clan AA aspartic protease
MGHVYQDVKLAAVKEAEVRMFVDTGATYSIISPELADQLGVVRLPRKLTLSLADGRRIEAEVGAVTVQINDRSGGTIVAIVKCESPLLGVETLEALGLGVDLSSGTLTPTRSWTARA